MGGAVIGSLFSGIGGLELGLPSGVDDHRWPVGRGVEQAAGEAPRTIPKLSRAKADVIYKLRARRLKALGNSVMPQCATIAGLVLRDELMKAGL